MGALLFDGVDDRVKFSTLAAVLADIPGGAYTIAALLRRGTPTGTYDGIVYLLSGSGSGVTEAGMSFKDSNIIFADIDGMTGPGFASTFTDTTDPYLVAFSKATGTSGPRLGWKLGSGGSWTHVNHNTGNPIPDQIDATMLEIGAWEAGDPFEGHIGLIGVWSGAMSDGNKEALDDNWRTSDWYNSAHGTPLCLIEFNVAATSLVDLIGNATNRSNTGTTLDSGETLDSWNFDGTGAVVTTHPGWYGSSQGWT